MAPEVINTVSRASILGYKYLVLDTPNKLWKEICRRFGVKLKCDDYHPNDCRYVLREVVIRKRDLSKFREVSLEVTKEMHKRGLNSYEVCCKEMIDKANRTA